MLLELSEVLACPACGPPQVMVAVVHGSRGREVVEGILACPSCDGRWPIAAGVARLDSGPANPAAPASETAATADTPSATRETALLAAALLGLETGGGLLLFGHGLAAVAEAVASTAERWNVVALVAGDPAGDPAAHPNLSHVAVPADVPLPLQGGRFHGAVLFGSATAARVAGAARVLAPGGRLVILDPTDASIPLTEEAGLEVRASDHRAVLAVRTPRGRP